jgi:flagellar protein FlbD
MIRLTRINRVPLVLNSDLIEHVEVTPDTVISMVSGLKFVVRESADEVIGKVKDFKRSIASRQEPPVVSEPAVVDEEDSPAGEEQS